jgi:hypothetical protein
MRVLDAWAVMALLKGEQPAAERVRAMFKAAERGDQTLLMNIVNVGECFTFGQSSRQPMARG